MGGRKGQNVHVYYMRGVCESDEGEMYKRDIWESEEDTM